MTIDKAERATIDRIVRECVKAGMPTPFLGTLRGSLADAWLAALAARESEITVWTCMSCGSHGEGQSCRDCGHEAMPGRWLSAEGIERQLKDAWQQRDEALAAREELPMIGGQLRRSQNVALREAIRLLGKEGMGGFETSLREILAAREKRNPDGKIQMYNLGGEYPELPTRLLEWPDLCTEIERANAAEQREQALREALKEIGETFMLNSGATADGNHLRELARNALATSPGGNDD